MAAQREQTTAKDTTEDQAPPARRAATTVPQMPDGKGALEYRRNKKIHICKAGRVVKGNWVGRVLDHSVRVYYGAAEAKLPDPVKQAVLASGIEIGLVTLEEIGLKPKGVGIESAIVNLTRQAAEE